MRRKEELPDKLRSCLYAFLKDPERPNGSKPYDHRPKPKRKKDEG